MYSWTDYILQLSESHEVTTEATHALRDCTTIFAKLEKKKTLKTMIALNCSGFC